MKILPDRLYTKLRYFVVACFGIVPLKGTLFLRFCKISRWEVFQCLGYSISWILGASKPKRMRNLLASKYRKNPVKIEIFLRICLWQKIGIWQKKIVFNYQSSEVCSPPRHLSLLLLIHPINLIMSK